MVRLRVLPSGVRCGHLFFTQNYRTQIVKPKGRTMARIQYNLQGILAFFCILLGACSNGEDAKCRDASVSRFEGIVFVLSTGVGTFSKSTQCMVFLSADGKNQDLLREAWNKSPYHSEIRPLRISTVGEMKGDKIKNRSKIFSVSKITYIDPIVSVEDADRASKERFGVRLSEFR